MLTVLKKYIQLQNQSRPYCDNNVDECMESTSEQISDNSEFSDKEKQQDILNMQEVGLLEDERVLKKMKQIPSSTISIYSPQAVDSETKQTKNTRSLYRYLTMGKLCTLENLQLSGCSRNMKMC